MTEDLEIDDSDDPLFDPLLEEIQFGGIGIEETWRVQTDIEEFLQKYARHVGLADVTLKYTIGDQLGTRSLRLHLSDRCLFSHEVVVGIQTEVLTKWPQWTVALVGYSREGEIASISATSVTANSENVNHLEQFMQQFADEEMSEWQRRFGPLQRQIQFVETQLGHKGTITETSRFRFWQSVSIGRSLTNTLVSGSSVTPTSMTWRFLFREKNPSLEGRSLPCHQQVSY